MKKFLSGLLVVILGVGILWLSVSAMQLPALKFVGFCGFVLGLVIFVIGGGMALGCER